MVQKRARYVGASGVPVGLAVDPTKNVLDLVEATIVRVDDLRHAETRRVDQLATAERRRINEKMSLTAKYEGKLRKAEAKRIDAIRTVDVNAGAVASSRASDQASVLANQVAQSADTLRTLVATTATTLATQLQTSLTALTERIAALEQSQYVASGRGSISNPLDEARYTALANSVAKLQTGSSTTTGKSAGMNAVWSYLIAAIGAAGLIVGIVMALVHR